MNRGRPDEELLRMEMQIYIRLLELTVPWKAMTAVAGTHFLHLVLNPNRGAHAPWKATMAMAGTLCPLRIETQSQ